MSLRNVTANLPYTGRSGTKDHNVSNIHSENAVTYTLLSFDVTASNVSFLRGSNTQLRDVTAGPFTAGPLSDVTPLQCTADPTPEPHGRTSSRDPSHSFLVVTSIATIGTFEAIFFVRYVSEALLFAVFLVFSCILLCDLRRIFMRISYYVRDNVF